MTLVLRQRPSPNFNERDPSVPLRYVVLHYTGTETAEAWLAAAADPAAERSAHYMVDEDGGVVQLVDENRRAWHAGKSFWRGITDLNSASIGIELANPGHEWGYRVFPAVQMAALKELAHDIINRHHMDPRTALLAHSDIAPARKQDPGELFPWQALAAEGLGWWPEVGDKSAEPFDPGTGAAWLRSLGYDCPGGGFSGPVERAALLAFQRRYVPHALTGLPDRETMARLKSLTTRSAR